MLSLFTKQKPQTLKVLDTKQRGSILRDVLEVAHQDYQRTMGLILGNEVAQQKALKNPVSRILVDGKRHKQIEDVDFRIDAFFTETVADVKWMLRAVEDAKAAVRAYGKRDSGYTLFKMAIYQQTGRSPPRMVFRVNPDTITRATDLYVAVPVAWTRKWQYYSKTAGFKHVRRTQNKRSLPRLRAIAAGGKSRGGTPRALVQESVFDRAAKSIKAKYAAHNIDVFKTQIKVPNLNPKGKTVVDWIPVVKIRMTLKGRIRNG